MLKRVRVNRAGGQTQRTAVCWCPHLPVQRAVMLVQQTSPVSDGVIRCPIPTRPLFVIVIAYFLQCFTNRRHKHTYN